MLAGVDGFEHQRAGDAVAADQLDDDVDLGIGDDLARIGDDAGAVADDLAGALDVQVRHHRDLDAAARTAADLFLVASEHVEGAATDSTDAQQADLDGFHANGWRL